MGKISMLIIPKGLSIAPNVKSLGIPQSRALSDFLCLF